MMFVQDPHAIKSYIVWSILCFAFVFQNVSLEGYFSKNIPKEVRGVMAGFLAFCGLIGRSICFKLGGTLFGMGRAMPFIMIGMANFIFVLFLLVCLFLGLFGREPKKGATAPRRSSHKKPPTMTAKKLLTTSDLEEA
jgi:hypothetical protein